MSSSSSSYRHHHNKRHDRFRQSEHIKSTLSSVETFLHFLFGACSYACNCKPSTSSVYSNTPDYTYDETYIAVDDDDHKSNADEPLYRGSTSHRTLKSDKRKSDSESRRSTSRNIVSEIELNRENTTLAISRKDNDDDVSCISTNTLDKDVNAKEQYARVDHANKMWNTNMNSISDKENLMSHSARSIQDALSVSESFASMASSNGTSEFSSIWKQPLGDKVHTFGADQNASSSLNNAIMVDNIHGHRSKPSQTSHSLKFYESPGSRKLRRQIMTDGIGAIDEVSSEVPIDRVQSFMSDEQEI